MAAPAYRSSDKATTNGGTSVTVTKPAGTVADDILIAVVAWNSGATITPPAGWTLLRTDTDGALTHKTYYKVAGGSEGASYQWSFSAGADAAAAVAAYSGGRTSSPINAHGGNADGDATVTAPSITTNKNNCKLVGLFAINGTTGIGGGAGTWTPASGMTEREDSGGTTNVDVSVELADETQATAGASGSRTATAAPTVLDSVGALLAIAPANTAPNAPGLAAPANGAIADLQNTTPTFSWAHSDPDGDAQDAYALRRKIGAGAYEYWNAGTSAWQAGEVWNVTATQQVTFATGKWTNGNVYDWSVKTRDPDGLAGPYASDRQVTAENPPTLNVTAPAGTIEGTTRPVVVWTYTDTNPQRSYQARIFTAAQYGIGGFDPATSPATWDSGEVLSTATSVEPTTDLAIGVTYRAYVRVSEAGPLYSVWDFSEFILAADVAQTPTFTVAAEDDPVSGPRAAIDVQGRDNLLTENGSSLETDLDEWDTAPNVNCTVARSTAQSLHGSASLRMTATAGGDMRANSDGGTLGMPVIVGETYRGRASLRAATVGRNVQAGIVWWNAAGAFISQAFGAAAADTTTGWTEVTVDAVAPAGAAYASLILNVANAGAGEQHYADQLAVTPAAPADWTVGGVLASQEFDVERSLDGGVTWTAIRSSPAVRDDAYQRVTVYDYEAPLGVPVAYRVRTRYTGEIGEIASDWVEDQPDVTLAATAWWLKDFEDPSLNIQCPIVGSEFTVKSREDQGVFLPLGRELPMIVSDVIRGEEFSLRMFFRTVAHYEAFEVLRRRQRALLLQSDMGDSWTVRLGAERTASIPNYIDRIATPRRFVEISAVEVSG